MSNNEVAFRRRQGECGQTIVLVAIALVSLLGMAALAIDVTTLYVARGEMQRAADAAALAGAKAFVDSGYTSDPTNTTRQALAQTMATSVINSILAQNNVSGAPPVLVAATPDFTHPGNPQISVTLQRTDLPTFFARIWGTRLATVTATTIAEAYNPSNAPAGYPPIAPKCVKPLLVVNQDPNPPNAPFINATTGVPSAGLVGRRILLQDCDTPPCAAGRFRPALVDPASAKLCPACQGTADYENGIECCDSTAYACGGTTPLANVAVTLLDPQLSNETREGVRCLTNHPTEDTLDPTSLGDLSAGTGPARITAGSGPQSGNLVTTSRSIANLPVIESPTANPVRVIGFLQVFIEPVVPGPPVTVPADILNVIGCGTAPGGGAAVSGGGYSSIPVRLVHN
jgi:Flp pilus assembly protein TadG